MLGITEAELDEQCDDLFNDTPIKFIPRKGNQIDEKIKFYIKELMITIPIVHIKGDLYLLGSERLNFKQNQNTDSLLVRVGGGYVKFEEHILKFSRYYQRMLVVYMIKSGESLEWVIEQLVNNKKIINLNQVAEQEALMQKKFKRVNSSKLSLSPAPRSPTTGGTRQFKLDYSGQSGFGSSTPTNRGAQSFRSKNNQPYSMTRTAYSPKTHTILKYDA